MTSTQTTIRRKPAAFGLAAAAFTLLVSASGPSQAQAPAADAVRVRGTVVSLDGTTLAVKSRDGADVSIALNEGWQVTGVTSASLESIKAGDFVGVAALPKPDGTSGALEVLIFPAGMKGTGEGHYPWDLEPTSTMTNATVSNAVQAVDGRSLTLTYDGGTEKTIEVPEKTPVVTFAPAETSSVAPGATVFVPATKAADGTLSAGFVVVGANGVVPPM